MFGPANSLVPPGGSRAYSELHELRQPLAFSAGGHLALLLLAIIGIPFLHSKPLEPVKTISVTMVAVSDMARTKHVAPPTTAKDEDDDEPDTATQPPVVSSLPPPPPPPTPPVEKTITPPPPELPPPPPAKADIAPVEKLKPIQQAVKPLPQVVPMPALQKPLPVVKPPPLPKPPEKVTQKQDQDFQSLVTNLAQPVEKADQVTHDKASHHPHQSAIAEASNQMTADELSALREALKRCWIVPAGVMNAENLVVVVEADYNENMTMKGVPTLVDTEDRYNRDPAYRAAADSALRALRNPECATLPFPAGKYDDWHHINLTFDPKTMMSP